MRWLLLVWLVLGAVGGAEPEGSVTVRFDTDPAGAEVYLLQSGQSGHASYLGRSGSAVALPREWLTGRSFVQIQFRKPGFALRLERIPAAYLLGDTPHWPPTRPLKLEPKTPAAWCASRPAWALGGAAALLSAALLGLALGRRRRRLRLRRALVSPQPDPLVGRCLRSYLLVEQVARAEATSVYRALPAACPERGPSVAIKLWNRPAPAEELVQEVQACTRLVHPNIVQMLDYGDLEGRFYVVTEWMPGGTLAARLRPGGLPLEEASGYLLALMEAVKAAHRLGIVHRDLKPTNVMFDERGRLKVIDFGLAASLHSTSGDASGTPAYMAPEQAGGGAPSPLMDQYAVGLIAFELLTGQRPFRPGGTAEQLVARLRAPAPRVRELRPEVPAPLDEAVARMLERDPGHRFPDLSAAARAVAGGSGYNQPGEQE